ncbi:MAG: DUF4388 domain-containing protein [Leptolyngbya sp. SIO4C1]|nr:DUF4388 domain-containing protein [Leptolyngbya sp. SIO4C1]
MRSGTGGMSMMGYLSEFSLPEVLQVLQAGKKTGLLAVQSLAEIGEPAEYYFIWVHKGRIVSAASRLDGRYLASLLHRHHQVTALMIARLIRRCPPDMPLGMFLCDKGVLHSRQLKALFSRQVIQQVCGLFQLSEGCFQLDPRAPLPKVEMTGLSIPATEVTLPGLRALKDWNALQNKLPSPQSGLQSLVGGQPNIRINQIEWNVWTFTNGKTPLTKIAQQLNLPLETVQKVAFRLIVVGLAEEVPMMIVPAATMRPISSAVLADAPLANTNGLASGQKLSQNFLKSLMSYLRQLPKSS